MIQLWSFCYSVPKLYGLFRTVPKLCLTLCDPMACRMPDFSVFIISWSLLRIMYIESMMLSHHLVLCHPILLLTSVSPSIRVFFNELALCTRWPNYWNFSFSISPLRNIQCWLPLELTGLISLQSKGNFEVRRNRKIMSNKAKIYYFLRRMWYT